MRIVTALAVSALLAGAGGCQRQDPARSPVAADAGAAPTESAEGAAGVVATNTAGQPQGVESAAAAAGGPAGQTPPYGQPGGAPSQVQSPGGGRGPSVGEDAR
jgi:hypothetical protein